MSQMQKDYKDQPVVFLSFSVSRRDSNKRLGDLRKQYQIEYAIGNLDGNNDVFGAVRVPDFMIIDIETKVVVWEKAGIPKDWEFRATIDKYLGKT